MSLSLIEGLPGSGKTCYCVSLLYGHFRDWIQYERREGRPYPRRCWTNVPLDIEALNESLRGELGGDVDVSEYVVVLDYEFFRGDAPAGQWCRWWEKFENEALIVIDEVHHYLPASLKRKNQDYSDRWMEYVSMHRHNRHDIIFLTQSLSNITTEVKNQIETVYSVRNVKNRSFPFPISIPFADVDVVKEAWGVDTQFCHVYRGAMHGRKMIQDADPLKFFLTRDLFRLYRSHTKSKESSDRPSLKLSRLGSLWWFAKRHVWHLGLKAILAWLFYKTVLSVAYALPGVIASAMVPGEMNVVAPSSGSAPGLVAPVPATAPAEVEGGASTVTLAPLNDEILGFVRGGVITARGVLRRDDHIMVDGDKDYVSSVDLVRGILYLGSGKKVQK